MVDNTSVSSEAAETKREQLPPSYQFFGNPTLPRDVRKNGKAVGGIPQVIYRYEARYQVMVLAEDDTP